MNTTIEVETIEYYNSEHQDITFNSLPPELNKERKYIDISYLRIPFLNLDVEGSENQKTSKSFQTHFLEHGCPKAAKPDCVTDAATLTRIASRGSIRLRILRNSGVILIWSEVSEENQSIYENVLRNYFVHASESESIPKFCGIFTAKVSIGGRDYCNVLYSGEVDAIDKTAQKHYSFEVTSSAMNTSDFWENKSEKFFWKATLRNIHTLVVGTRTGKREEDPKTKEPLNYPELSVYKIEMLERCSIPMKVSEFAARPRSKFSEWSVVHGEIRLEEFMKLIKKTIEGVDGERFIFTRNAENEQWITTKEAEESQNV